MELTKFIPPTSRLPLLVLLFMFSTAAAQDLVRIDGHVVVPSQLRSQVVLTMDVGDTSCVHVKLHGRGRFTIETRDTTRYVLRFEQDGSITRSVMVNTRNVRRKVGKKVHHIDFDVVMLSVDTVLRQRYAGPVGRIDFRHSNGRMVIQRDKTMVDESVFIWNP